MFFFFCAIIVHDVPAVSLTSGGRPTQRQNLVLRTDTSDYKGFHNALKAVYGPYDKMQSSLWIAKHKELLTDKSHADKNTIKS